MGLAVASRAATGVRLAAAPRPAPRALGLAAQTAAAGALLFASVVFLQARAGAFDSELGAHPDESAHYVTGLMVRQYIVSGRWSAPMRFAEEYYLHYPRVAFGQWPPLFHAVQAGWTLLFSPSRHSVMLLMAALTTCLAGTLFVAARAHCGALPALALALALVASPLVQRSSGMVMAEMLVAPLSFLAALSFGRFLDRGGRWRDAVWFGAWTAAALLAKGNAMALALMVPVAILLAGRPRLALRPALWVSAAMLAVVCGPWYWLTAGMAQGNFIGGRGPNLGYARFAAGFYLWQLARAVGWGLLALAVLGLAASAIAGWTRRHGQLAAAAALVLATWVFHLLAPSSREARHMVMAVAPLLLLAGAGLAWLEERWGAAGTGRAALASAVLVVFALDVFYIPVKAWHGFSEVADRLLRDLPAEGSRILVSADTRGEGMFISEMASRQPQPRHQVLRASKVLARMGWNGEDYQLLHRSPEQVARYLDDVGVGAVILDRSLLEGASEPHHGLLAAAIAAHPDRWTLPGAFSLIRNGVEAPGALAVYRRVGGTVPPRLRLDPRELLRGKSIVSFPPSPEVR